MNVHALGTHAQGVSARRIYTSSRGREETGKSPAIISCGSPPIVHVPLASSSSVRDRFARCGGRGDGDANGGRGKSRSVTSSATALRKGSRSGMLAISHRRYSSGTALISWSLYLPKGMRISSTSVTTCGHSTDVDGRGQVCRGGNIRSSPCAFFRMCPFSSLRTALMMCSQEVHRSRINRLARKRPTAHGHCAKATRCAVPPTPLLATRARHAVQSSNRCDTLGVGV